ncbi:MAG: hypothetical protein H0T45_08150 [Pyrinomonadaceae bacterium]|nr:hypothetical protein [Pyrinomonadaceae bacterium]MDQ3134983.1 hypothetical protein [Acidobacteriota bacterium]
MPDWQSIVVVLIVIAAALYAGRRAWSRLRSFVPNSHETTFPESSCGKCEAKQPQRDHNNTLPTVKVLVQIERSLSSRR